MKLSDLVDLTPVNEGSDENGTFKNAPAPIEKDLTVAQAAKIERVTPSRIRQKIANGELRAKKPVEGRRDSLLDRREVFRDARKQHKKTGRPVGT